MSAIVMDGKKLAAKIRNNILFNIKHACEDYVIEDHGNKKCMRAVYNTAAPKLAVILVGDDPASAVYVKNKSNDCKECGIYDLTMRLSKDTSEKELLDTISIFNNDSSVTGIIVQLPLPEHINQATIINAISPDKDVDCFHPINVGKLYTHSNIVSPCTPAGVIRLLDEYNIDIAGKQCVVIGRSNVVGKPMAELLSNRNGTVTLCHSKTTNLSDYTSKADIIVSAVGKRNIVTADMIKPGCVLIDVGMNRDENGKLCGDIDYAGCSEIASYITPVPGGVGPMTRAILMENVYKLWMNTAATN